MSYVIVDVESDGPIPAEFSMVCFGAVLFDDTLEKSFYGKTKPISDRFVPEALAVSEMLGGELVPMGSAGAKAMAVIRGEADIYLHSGGQYEWDSCAPVAVARANGLHCSRIDGSPLVYNQADTYMPDLLICRPEHAQTILNLVAGLNRDCAGS